MVQLHGDGHAVPGGAAIGGRLEGLAGVFVHAPFQVGVTLAVPIAVAVAGSAGLGFGVQRVLGTVVLLLGVLVQRFVLGSGDIAVIVTLEVVQRGDVAPVAVLEHHRVQAERPDQLGNNLLAAFLVKPVQPLLAQFRGSHGRS